ALFAREAVEALRDRYDAAAPGERDGLRELLRFGVDGLLGEATKGEATELAELESSLELEVAGERIPSRTAPVVEANEPDAARRAEIDAARNDLLHDRLTPLQVAALERVHELIASFGWPSYADAYAELRGIDLAALAEQARAFLAA